MKWLSVEKYKPPKKERGEISEDVFAYCDGRTISIAYYDWVDDVWMCKNPNWPPPHTITHFCIPDPIEIEEDE